MLTLREKVWWFALYSRLILLAASSVSNLLLSDHAADAFVGPRSPEDQEEHLGDVIVRLLFGGLVRWDAHYFLHISLYGYTFENCLAFFPLFPLMIRFVAGLLSFVPVFLSWYSLHVLSAVLINFCCFIKSAVVLHDLSLQISKDSRIAYVAALFYCINPASIFFTAPYSETLFALLSFYGMLMCSKGLIMNCSILFGLAATVRSNGILSVGFIVYYELKRIINIVFPHVLREARRAKVSYLSTLFMVMLATLANLFPCLVATVLALMPFVGFQAYSYFKFCIPQAHNLPEFLVTYAETHGLVLPGSNLTTIRDSHWCGAQIPLAYSYIQDHYWGVGFLQYYEWKQVPNFLLAFPIISIVFVYALRFFKNNFVVCLTLGLIDWKSDKGRVKNPLMSADMFVFMFHAVALAMFSLLVMNVQVTTRFISSASPVLYWVTSSTYTVSQNFRNYMLKIKQSENVEFLDNMYSLWRTLLVTHNPQYTIARLTRGYFLLYFFLGTVMFSNFYPWT